MRGQKNNTVKFLGMLVAMAFCAAGLHAGENGAGMTLTEALETALQKNPSMKSVRAQRDATEARIGEAKADFFPEVVIASGYTRYNEPNIIVPIHQTGVFPPLDNDIYETVTRVRIPIFSGGRTVAATRASRASADETEALEALTKMQLLERIISIYIQALELEDNRALLAARLQVLRQRRGELNLLRQEGRASPADLALVQSSLAATRSDSLEVEFASQQLAIRLGQLLGSTTPTHPFITEVDFNSGFSGADTLTTALRPAGPEVRRAEARLAHADAIRAGATRSFWPELSGFASYSLRSGGDLNMTGEWAVGLTLSLPIFDGGRRVANLRAAKASFKAAQEANESAQQTQSAALILALTRYRSSQNRQDYLSQAVDEKARSVAAQRQMYQAGRLSLSELLTQETELLQLQVNERQVAYDGRLAILNYHATAGILTIDLAEKIVRNAP